MSNQKDQMKWVLFWVFLTLFIIMVLGTLAMVFLGFGSPTESERELMVKGLIGEVAACIIALFYSIFGLKGSSEDSGKVQELENTTAQILATVEALNVINSNVTPTTTSDIDNGTKGGTSPTNTGKEKTFENKVSPLNQEPPFPLSEYSLTPLPLEIKNDIQKAKPIDTKHRQSSYTGMKVQWKAVLSTADEIEDGKIRVTADLDESILYVFFEIDRNSNNNLLIADEHEPFWICGEISEAEAFKIYLKDVQIQFKDKT